jgi:hypothetical protein
MKTALNILFVAILAAFSGSTGRAQMIYSNNFALGGATNISGSAPTVATNFAGGISSAAWNDALGYNNTGSMLANGTNSTTLGDSWTLPFAPQNGYVYTLTGSLTFTGNPGGWVGLGFAEYAPVNSSGRFADSYVNGYDWMILTESSGNVQYFSGARANSPAIYNANNTFTANTPQTISVQVILNTTGSAWTITAYVNGVQMGSTFSYAGNPPLGGVGITQQAIGAPANYKWNYLSLAATGTGPATGTVNATVTFSSTNTGKPLNSTFCGMSYEKSKMTTVGFFASTNTTAIHLFRLISTPAVLRLAGGTVDQTGWNGISNTYPITASEVDALAGFMNVLPGNWKVIYGINMASNTPANAAAEAVYAANDLGTNLLGFEIGNEPEYYANFSYSSYRSRWRSLAAAITNAVPDWAVTNGGNGWIFADTDAGQGQLAAITDPFASDESGVVSLLTQHYYRASTGSMQLLLQPDTSILLPLVTNIVGAAAGHQTLGARITECGSYSAGGIQGISDVYGAALWSLDFMFTMAVNGGQGVNFHGGGQSPYSPLIDDGVNVQRVGPEFYGLKMFSLLPSGNVIPAAVTVYSGTNFTAYGVRQINIGISALLNNKDANNTVAVTVNLGTNVISAQLIGLTGPSLSSASSYTLGGAIINAADGTWKGGVQAVLPATNGQLTVNVPPASAYLLNPVVAAPGLTSSVNGSQMTMTWPMNYTGWLLKSNSTGLATTNWFLVPGSGGTNRIQITIQPGQGNVFYRLSSQ